ncbi:Modification methylase PaeR7I [Caloramator mitchellensis]|uniref:site-specific DNA-methyltransferase (adenine-specific) n=1 Tax=Caloramator mitchellensis TaxID=908809 RepID=A0A0R3JV47_CALMK|nr:N-6 DNA methylase [Caloramator mitchellensis]KRQ87467.1 Modification methylase PaeR7I [Caloramator mitchellensis]
MLQEFLREIDVTYDCLIAGQDRTDEFYSKWGVANFLGETYQELLKKEDKKDKGSVYTPKEVVDFMVKDLISLEEYKKNTYIKILDPSCGGGYFLLYVYNMLVEFAKELGIEKPNEHVIKNNIFGYDIDSSAIKITSIELYRKSRVLPQNIILKDFILDCKEQFDFIIANPPYMGHKIINGDYRNKIAVNFRDVFYDKGDLSYCFIKKAIDSIKTGGRFLFFTSRYLLEAQNAEGIRKYILRSGTVNKIIDFYGLRVFKGAGIDNIIIDFSKTNELDKIDYIRFTTLEKNINDIFEDINRKKYNYTKHVEVLKREIENGRWQFLNSIEKSILNKIKGVEIGQFANTYQGIITGCDDAFIVSMEDAEYLNIEKELLRPWIKSKNIKKFTVEYADKFIIYSNLIDDEYKYNNAIEYIGRFRQRLEKRRECKNGFRKWFQLQWGRDLTIFEDKKIVFPFKANSNRFAIDRGNLFSADVYALVINGMFREIYSYEFLAGVLNSSIYEFYIKTMLKKLGDDLYEYYPYNLIRIKIPDFIKDVEDIVLKQGKTNIEEIDNILIEKFNITNREFEEVKFWLNS